MNKRIVAALATVLLVSGSGCVSSKPTVKSAKREGYDRRLGKTLLVVELPLVEADVVADFMETLQRELALRGAEGRIASRPDLAAGPGRSVEEQAVEAGATTVLTVLQDGCTRTVYGSVVRVKLTASLRDLGLGREVWVAAYEHVPGSGVVQVRYRAELLTYELVLALVSDGLLRGPFPAPPEPTPRPFDRLPPSSRAL